VQVPPEDEPPEDEPPEDEPPEDEPPEDDPPEDDPPEDEPPDDEPPLELLGPVSGMVAPPHAASATDTRAMAKGRDEIERCTWASSASAVPVANARNTEKTWGRARGVCASWHITRIEMV
jgi:hypothetical protein